MTRSVILRSRACSYDSAPDARIAVSVSTARCDSGACSTTMPLMVVPPDNGQPHPMSPATTESIGLSVYHVRA